MHKKAFLIRGRHRLQTNYKSGCVAAFPPHFVFSLTGVAEKRLISEKPLNERFFKNTGVGIGGDRVPSENL